MFGQTFYHRTLRKYVTYFGTLFNDIYINRETPDNQTVQTLRVPITYSAKEKALARLDADPNLNRPASAILPFLAFEMTSLQYAPSRKLTTINKGFVKPYTTNDPRLKYVYNPVPYDINFSLYLMVKNAEDGTKILEQILPYFTPEWTATLNLIPELNVKIDTPVVIQNIVSEDTYEGDYSQRRVLTWTLDFVMYGYLFGPVKKSGVITLAKTNFFADIDDTDPSLRVEITPGLTSNGTPTTDPNETIDRDLIKESDDWDYIVKKEYGDE